MSSSKSIQVFIHLIKQKQIPEQALISLRELSDHFSDDLEEINQQLLAWLKSLNNPEILSNYKTQYRQTRSTLSSAETVIADQSPETVTGKHLGLANTKSSTPVDQSSEVLKDQLLNTIHQNSSPSDPSQSQSSSK